MIWPFTAINAYWLAHASAQNVIMRPKNYF